MANSTKWCLKIKALIPRELNKVLEEWIQKGKFRSKAEIIRIALLRLIEDENTRN